VSAEQDSRVAPAFQAGGLNMLWRNSRLKNEVELRGQTRDCPSRIPPAHFAALADFA